MPKRLLTVLLITLAGCTTTTAPKIAQVSAGQWVDEQITQSAGTLNQAQIRLHQTSAARAWAPITAPALVFTPAPKPAQVSVPKGKPLDRVVPVTGG